MSGWGGSVKEMAFVLCSHCCGKPLHTEWHIEQLLHYALGSWGRIRTGHRGHGASAPSAAGCGVA